MTKFDINSSIGSLLNFYRQEKNIFGRCPHCGQPFRISEVKLTYGKEPPRDLLTRMKSERDRLKEQLDELEAEIEDAEFQRESELEDAESKRESDIQALNDKWNDKVSTEVERQLGRSILQIRKDAIAKARVGQLGKTL